MNSERDNTGTADTLEMISDLLHQITWNVRLDQLGTWSEKLKGMSQIDLHILKMIAERPALILKDICNTLHIPNSTLTSAINRLEERGLLNRIISQRDRRSYGLELTDKGWNIKHEHDRVDRLIAGKVFAALADEAEAQTLVSLLHKVNHSFNQSRHPEKTK